MSMVNNALIDNVLTRKTSPSFLKAKKRVIYILLFALCVIISIIFAFPFVYMALMSLMKDSDSIFLYPTVLYCG